jgi:catechol 2,3-dioxygenase-like lactoylglutathione lyase family enzyme
MTGIDKVDHIGIRITDRARSLAFYQMLGFQVLQEVDFDAVIIVKNEADVELNLIVNGIKNDGQNILMDVPHKYPGITHVAFRVTDFHATLALLKAHQITPSQGPVTFGDGHVSVFVRDPDRNVIELRARLSALDAEKIEGLVFYDPKA